MKTVKAPDTTDPLHFDNFPSLIAEALLWLDLAIREGNATNQHLHLREVERLARQMSGGQVEIVDEDAS